MILAASLAAVILHHFLEALFAALRKFSIVSTMQFCQSMLFAAISLALLWFWRSDAESVVVGYGAACLVSAVVDARLEGQGAGGGSRAGRGRRRIASSGRRWCGSRFGFGSRTCLCHLFAVVDRYMLVHWSGLENADALALVGHYHASRIVPLLFLSRGRFADGRRHAVLEPRLGSWRAAARVGPAESHLQVGVACDVRRRRVRAAGVAAVVPRTRSTADTTRAWR